MIAVLTTMTFYFVTVYHAIFGKELHLSPQDTLLVTLLVAVTNFIWNPVGGALSDRVGRKPVLMTIAGLSFVTAYPALLWLTAAPTFGKMLAVEMMFSFYFGVYSGTMLGALVEIVPTHVRTTCFSMAFALAAALFGTFTPFADWADSNDRRQGIPRLLADVRCGDRHHRRRSSSIAAGRIETRDGGRRVQLGEPGGPGARLARFDFHANNDNKSAWST